MARHCRTDDRTFAAVAVKGDLGELLSPTHARVFHQNGMATALLFGQMRRHARLTRPAQPCSPRLDRAPVHLRHLCGGGAGARRIGIEGANVLFMFIDRLLHQDAEGEPKNGGAYRMVAMIVRGTHAETGGPATFISRVYAPSDSAGPYLTQVQADVAHEMTLSGMGEEPLSGRHVWRVEHDGGELVVAFDYEGGVPSRRQGEATLSTPLDPSVARIYRFDQLTDVVNSAPRDTERTSDVTISVTIPELAAMFDGTHELIGLADRPFYTRETFKP